MRSSHQNLKQETLRDPDTKKYYESLEEEFSILGEFIREGKACGKDPREKRNASYANA